MGFLLKPSDSSLSSTQISFRRQTAYYFMLNRLIFVTFFVAVFLNQTNNVLAASDQIEQQDDDLRASCETKTLDDEPPDPFYDASYVTVTAATKLSEFIVEMSKGSKSTKFSPQKIDTFTKYANNLANEALKEDENLLAFGLAAPSVPLAVIQFREKIDNRNVTDHKFFNIYWRELGKAWNKSDQFWGAPFRDCGPMQGRWLWPFSATFVVQHMKTVASSFIAADLDACLDALEPIFGKRHSCDRETTFCLMTEPEPAESVTQSQSTATGSRAKYTCVCKEGFYVPNETLQGFSSDKIENETGNFSCLACPSGCIMCDKDGSCIYGHEEPEDILTESVLRASIGAILIACVSCCFVLSFIVFRQRKCKTIATGMWTILETILIGILFLYSAVALHFLPATSLRCMLEPWLREIGFIICYGAIVLKLYRHLVEFRTRKAHRYVVRDLDLLRMLCAMIVAVLCYLAAFSALCIDYLDYSELIWNVEMESITTSNMCKPLKWDYVTQAGELLILIFGIQLAYASRNANTQFRERTFLVASIVLEFVVSFSYYIIRDWYLSEFNPTTLLLALFLRSQLTSTITMLLIFLPKIYYQHKQLLPTQMVLAHELSFRLPVYGFKGAHESSHHHHGLSSYAGICIGDPEAGDLTISEMSPEEIRAELKRLYTQLEYLKNKTLRQDNPHISKRRGGRKVAHRRFSLQKKGSRDKALSAKHRNNRPPPSHEIEITEAEPSRTPEDENSVCSIEGPTDTGDASGISASK